MVNHPTPCLGNHQRNETIQSCHQFCRYLHKVIIQCVEENPRDTRHFSTNKYTEKEGGEPAQVAGPGRDAKVITASAP